MDEITELAHKIKSAKKIMVLTGAGISTESGIPDFKSTDDTWSHQLPRHIVMSTGFLQRKPKEFWPIYKEVFQFKLIGNYKPNFGHTFLAKLEQMGKNVIIATQNVDGMHTKAGNKNVYEVHGSISTSTCPKCKTEYTMDYINEHEVPRCNKLNGNGISCNFILKPGVVLFGDSIRYYNESVKDTVDADLFMVLGSSLEVGPINELPSFAYHNRYRDKPLTMAMINMTPTTMDDMFSIRIKEGIGDTFRKVEEIMNSL